MTPIKIIITDDHSMVREGLKQLLELEGDIQVIGEANDGFECLKLINELKPDVVLLDINMPNCNGLEVLEILKKENRKEKILILTIHNEVEYLLKAVEIGISGYVLKDSESAVLKKAIFSVNNGETFIQPSLTPLLNQKLYQNNLSIDDETDLLTKRELEVLKLLAEGLFNKEIAYKLSISEKTVKNHVSNIFKKISVSDRTQAAVYAIKNNIVELS
ncbi:response regulator [Anaeromicropila herbilytica]|uniref:Stage 0 sporulation protein A homolog n=1 Tax=Anaeromicropila herbilytica TaxID=2785025 RepID=A0A7R7IET2_9FIRM|nr:response regulator transcription factor [Anaeromicropila herbilytica]BCN33018.1 DNA-binding response regulator [Anaeromicropila herbilytica]